MNNENNNISQSPTNIEVPNNLTSSILLLLNEKDRETIIQDGYEKPELIGTGGMGSVWKACKNGQLVAIKFCTNTEKQFCQEIKTLQSTKGIQGIPNLINWNIDKCYYVMDFIEGQHLRPGQCSDSPYKSLKIIKSAAKILQALHHKGIIHRDVKPQNIILQEDNIFLVDLGLAKKLSSQTTTTPGFTPLYASPEQKSGQKVEHTTDIYSLGATLYALLCSENGLEDTNSEKFKTTLKKIPSKIRDIVVEAMIKRTYESIEKMNKGIENVLSPSYWWIIGVMISLLFSIFSFSVLFNFFPENLLIITKTTSFAKFPPSQNSFSFNKFSVDINFQKVLERGTINKDLRNEFQKNNNFLSSQITVQNGSNNDEWMIKDNANNRKYIVLKSNNSLTVYKLLYLWTFLDEGPIQKPLVIKDVQEFLTKYPFCNYSAEYLVNNSEYPDDKEKFGKQVLAQKTLYDILEDFLKQKGIFVKITFLTWEQGLDKLRAETEKKAEDRIPDVVRLGTTWIPAFISADFLQEIKMQSEERSRFLPTIVETGQLENTNKLFAIPMFVDMRFIAYKKKDFTEKDFSSWKDVLEACKRYKKGKPFLFSAERKNAPIHTYLLFHLCWGGEILTQKHACFSRFQFYNAELTTEAAEIADFLVQLAPFIVSEIDDVYQTENLFLGIKEKGYKSKQQEYSIIITGPGILSRLKENEQKGIPWHEQFGIIQISESPKNTRKTFLGGTSLSLVKKGNNPNDESTQLLYFLTRDEALGKFCKNGSLPSSSEGRNVFYKEFGCSNEVVDNLEKSLKIGKIYPRVPEWADFENKETVSTFWDYWRIFETEKPRPIQALSKIKRANKELNSYFFTGMLWAYSSFIGSSLVISVLLSVCVYCCWKSMPIQK